MAGDTALGCLTADAGEKRDKARERQHARAGAGTGESSMPLSVKPVPTVKSVVPELIAMFELAAAHVDELLDAVGGRCARSGGEVEIDAAAARIKLGRQAEEAARNRRRAAGSPGAGDKLVLVHAGGGGDIQQIEVVVAGRRDHVEVLHVRAQGPRPFRPVSIRAPGVPEMALTPAAVAEAWNAYAVPPNERMLRTLLVTDGDDAPEA